MDTILLKDFFDTESFSILQDHILFLHKHRETITKLGLGYRSNRISGAEVEETNGRWHFCRSDLIDEMMVRLTPRLNEMSGHTLLPKNHFVRAHTEETKGWPLGYHTDHLGNDVNVSINIYNDEVNRDWKLYFTDYDCNVTEYETTENQGVVYSGEWPHWRSPFPGGTYIQLFLHYTREDNPHVDWCRWNSRVWGTVTDVSPVLARKTPSPYVDYVKAELVLHELRKTRVIYDEV